MNKKLEQANIVFMSNYPCRQEIKLNFFNNFTTSLLWYNPVQMACAEINLNYCAQRQQNKHRYRILFFFCWISFALAWNFWKQIFSICGWFWSCKRMFELVYKPTIFESTDDLCLDETMVRCQHCVGYLFEPTKCFKPTFWWVNDICSDGRYIWKCSSTNRKKQRYLSIEFLIQKNIMRIELQMRIKTQNLKNLIDSRPFVLHAKSCKLDIVQFCQ